MHILCHTCLYLQLQVGKTLLGGRGESSSGPPEENPEDEWLQWLQLHDVGPGGKLVLLYMENTLTARSRCHH